MVSRSLLCGCVPLGIDPNGVMRLLIASVDMTARVGGGVTQGKVGLFSAFSVWRLMTIAVFVGGYVGVGALKSEYMNRAVQISLTRALRMVVQQERRYGSFSFLQGSNNVSALTTHRGIGRFVPRTIASTRPGIISVSTLPAAYAEGVVLFEESRTGSCWAIRYIAGTRYELGLPPKMPAGMYYATIPSTSRCSWDDDMASVERGSLWHDSWPQGWTW